MGGIGDGGFYRFPLRIHDAAGAGAGETGAGECAPVPARPQVPRMPLWEGQTLHRGVHEGALPRKEEEQGGGTVTGDRVTSESPDDSGNENRDGRRRGREREWTPAPVQKGDCVKKMYGKTVATAALAGGTFAPYSFREFLQKDRNWGRQSGKTAEPGENREGMLWRA